MTLSNDNGMSQHDPDAVGDDSLHTGDDARIDLVSSIIASAEEIQGDEEQVDIAASIISDCRQLDALLIETIKRERERAEGPSETPTQLQVFGDSVGVGYLFNSKTDRVGALHMTLNVVFRRAGVTMPACDGPDCKVCPQLVALAWAVPSPAPERQRS